MLENLYPELAVPADTVGFDMDGTLYDEFSFIHRIYAEILAETGRFFADFPEKTVLGFMSARWLEKGSSYPKLFGETFGRFGGAGRAEDFIAEAVRLFRAAEPRLVLTERTKFLLGLFADKYRLFLVSDGNPALQRRKAASLGLERFIPPANMIFTGDFGAPKPSPLAAERLPFQPEPGKTVFFGDRAVDADFCTAVGCRHVRVYAMLPIFNGAEK